MKPNKQTKTSKYIVEELRWFWCNSDADCGYKSSWCACLNAACFGQTVFADPYTPHVLNAINAKAQINAILRQIPECYQYVLYSLYGHTFYSDDVESMCKKLTGPMCCQMHHADLIDLCKRVKSGVAKGPEKAKFKQMLLNAEDDVAMAIMLYTEAKRLLGFKPLVKKHF
jgi:hypothetical protein